MHSEPSFAGIRLHPSKSTLAYRPVDLVFIYAVGGLIGTLYETLLIFVLDMEFQNRAGSILTPFNHVYGSAAMVIFLVFHHVRSIGALFLLGSLLGGFIEFTFSYFEERIFGCRSWDYTGSFFSIGGRTSLLFMPFWGLLCVLSIRWIFPAVLGCTRKLSVRTYQCAGRVLLFILLLDVLITPIAVHRYAQRINGVPANGVVAGLIDRMFSDTFMRTRFPNLNVLK